MIKLKTEERTPKRSSWRRKLVWVTGGAMVLLVAGYFLLTSGAFLKAVLLPRIGNAINAEVTVSSLQVSPFSQIVLRDLKVTPRGVEPLLTVGELRTRHSLLSILRGRIAVEELVVSNPTVTIVEHTNGTSNLDPILKALQPEAKEKLPTDADASASAPPSLDLKSVKLLNATLRQSRELKEGGRELTEVSGFNLTLSDVKNGQSGKLELSAALAKDQGEQPQVPPSSLGAKLAGAFTFDLTEALRPGAVKGSLTANVERATGRFTEAGGLVVKLEAEASPTEIRQLAVRFNRAAESLGELRVSGPFDATKLEGNLNVELVNVDRKLLNTFGAAQGLDFGTTSVSATNAVSLTRAGAEVSTTGRLDLARFQVTRQGQTTPTLDLRCDYSVTVDTAAGSAQLKSLNLAGTQDQRPLLEATLTAPMMVAWGDAVGSVGDSALNFAVNALDLADWRPFIGAIAPVGKASVSGKLLSQQAGKRLQFEARAGVSGLTVVAATNRFAGLGADLEARGEAVDLTQFKLTSFTAWITQNNQPLLSADGAGTYDLPTQAAEAEATAAVNLPALAQALPLPDIAISAGNVQMQTQLKHRTNSDAIKGDISLAGFTGSLGTARLADFGLATDLDAVKLGDKIQLLKATGVLSTAGQGAGSFDATGSYDLATKAGDVAMTLAGINQAALAPFLASALGGKTLVSVSVNSTVAAKVAANGDASAKANLQITNLVVNDPKGTLPSTPLDMRLQTDASVVGPTAQIRQLQLNLTPTERAKNQLDLNGAVDFSKSSAITGGLKLAAESLDVTRYYDLFAGDAKTAAKPAPSAAAPAGDPNQETEPVILPFRDFTLDAAIGRLHLREVAITNLQATAKLDGGHVLVKPCQFTLNGAPVQTTVDADLGVPGFKYDVAFSADKVPLTPLVNSFAPERKGQVSGTTTVGAQMKGAGVTGASLQKNLTGQFTVLSTNLDLSIANVRSPLINTIVNVIIGIPEMIRNPTAIVGNLLTSLTGANRPRGGWADQLTASRISVIDVRGSAGNGRVELQTAEVRSAAFRAIATGGITLDRVLTNSTLQFPVSVALSRELADKIGMVNANTPTNLSYIALPDFLKMKGTLGEPKTDINRLVLVGIAAQTGAGVARGITGETTNKVGSILGAVGNLLGAGAPSSPPASTNSAGTNQPQPVNLLDIFSKPKKQPPPTQ